MNITEIQEIVANGIKAKKKMDDYMETGCGRISDKVQADYNKLERLLNDINSLKALEHLKNKLAVYEEVINHYPEVRIKRSEFMEEKK